MRVGVALSVLVPLQYSHMTFKEPRVYTRQGTVSPRNQFLQASVFISVMYVIYVFTMSHQ